MPDEVLESKYLELCQEFPLFEKIGHRGFGTKVWLVFRALNFKSVSMTSVAENPCQSLMENDIHFNNIKRYLEELHRGGVLDIVGSDTVGSDGEASDVYKLSAENSYELHRICYQLGNKIVKSKVDLKKLMLDCGYTNDTRNNTLVNSFANGDVNAKADSLKNILSQLAFAGAKFLTKVVDLV